MSLSLGVSLVLHQLASVVWIGGMFFAHVALRPTLKMTLEPPARIQVAVGVFRRFFPWVWVCVSVLWVTGTWISVSVLEGNVGAHILTMAGIAGIMTLVFGYLYAMPYRRMRVAVEQESWRQASAEFARIRQLMAFNLGLGILTVVTAVFGPVAMPALAVVLGTTG